MTGFFRQKTGRSKKRKQEKQLKEGVTIMKVIEATGKKLDDAINEGLSQLGVKIDDVDVEILCSGSWLR